MTTLDMFPSAVPSGVRALSLWQPFASMVADGVKSIETRLWSTDYRGPFVVCATKKVAPLREMYGPTITRLIEAGEDPSPYDIATVPRGVALAVVELVDCRPMTEADEPKAWVPWRNDLGEARFAWVLSPKVVRLRPFPVKGGQSWFRLDSSLLVPEAACGT